MSSTQVRPEILPDEKELARLGYKPELARPLTWFGNFAFPFTIINLVAGVFTGFGISMGAGGPRVQVWGWIAVSLLILTVAAAMGELAAKWPISGGPYFWSYYLARKHQRAAAWFTGWLNFGGQVAGTAATDFAAAGFINILLSLQFAGYHPTKYTTLLICAVILAVHALVNTLSVRDVGWLNKVSVWWLLIGTVVIVTVLAVAPSHHQSAAFVFSHFENDTGFSFGPYAVGIGLLSVSWVFTGIDASAHMSEETISASRSAPKAMVRAVAVSATVGFVLLLALIWSEHDYAGELSSSFPPAQIVMDALTPTSAKLLLLIVIGALLFCGLSNMTSNSRLIFALSRDDGPIPGTRVWRKVNSRGTPVRAAWLAAGLSFLLVLPSLVNNATFNAVVSINVIGLFGAYAFPIFLKLRRGADFEPGPWHLGRWSRAIGVTAVVWVLLSSLLFLAPETYPITWGNFNYAPIAFAALLLIAAAWWALGARKRFQGPPKSTLTADQRAELDDDLGLV
jgi:amino acid transporter